MLFLKSNKIALSYIHTSKDWLALKTAVDIVKAKGIEAGKVAVETFIPDENYYRLSAYFFGYKEDHDNGYIYLESIKSIDPPGTAVKAYLMTRDMFGDMEFFIDRTRNSGIVSSANR